VRVGLVDNLQTNVVDQVLVGEVDGEVDAGLLTCHFEVVLGEEMVLALLKRDEVAGVLLAHETHLGDEVVLLRDD